MSDPPPPKEKHTTKQQQQQQQNTHHVQSRRENHRTFEVLRFISIRFSSIDHLTYRRYHVNL